MADFPLTELQGKTPLEYAYTPHMDYIAQHGVIGMAKTIPDTMSPGSDIANLSVLGYDPQRYYTGRSPLEAMSMGIELGSGDLAIRCNLVNLSDANEFESRVMQDHSADEITTEEAAQLIQVVKEHVDHKELEFYAGISYRHLMVWRNGPNLPEITPPHDIIDQPIGNWLPGEGASKVLVDLMRASIEYLGPHPVNRRRIENGLKPANALWFWGQGKKPMLPSFAELHGLNGVVIAGVDLTKGIGLSAGMDCPSIPGATGNLNTNFHGKAQAAVQSLASGYDFVFLHIEAPDEAGHRGEIHSKVLAIEAVDQVVGTVLEGVRNLGDCRVMVLPDHPTPVKLRTHVAEPVPVAIYQSGSSITNRQSSFNERAAASSGVVYPSGEALLACFLQRN